MAVNCWDYTKCGREKGGSKAHELGVCPAWPDHGQDCWFMAGTMCGGRPQGSFAEKLGSCQKCEFYEKTMGGEI